MHMSFMYKYIPNSLTILRIIAAPFLWYCIMLHAAVPALLLLSLAALSDFGDGYLARRMNVTTRSGCFLDPLADKCVVLAAFGAFWLQDVIASWVLWTIVARDIAVTLVRLSMAKRGVFLKTSFLAKSKTAIQFLALYALIALQGCAGMPLRIIGVLTALLTVASAFPYASTYARFIKRHS